MPAKQTLITSTLIVLLLGLQIQYWGGDANVLTLRRLKQKVAQQEQVNAELAARNQALVLEVQDLKSGMEVVESLAREEMGMIKRDESFYLIIEPGGDHERGT